MTILVLILPSVFPHYLGKPKQVICALQ